jgi:hypothetical protein
VNKENISHLKIQLIPDLVRTWYGDGMDLVWTWYGLGTDLVRTWYKFGTSMVRIWYEYGANMVAILNFKYVCNVSAMCFFFFPDFLY